MKQRKLASFIAVTLSLELMVAPIIPHVQAQSSNPTAAQKAQRRNNTAQSVNAGLQAVGVLWGSVSQSNMNNPYGGMNPQMAHDMQMLGEQMKLQPDKYFSPQKMSRIPGLGNYLALHNINPNMLNCPTLPTTLHEANPEVCRLGVMNDKGVPPAAQLTQMFTYHNQYFQVGKMYKNFGASSNSDGQSFGVGCMNNAMNILNGFFKYRLDELDKLTTNLEAIQADFKDKSRSDLDALEEAVAVLDGNSPLADKVRSKRPDLFDFNKRFKNPACGSMFSGDQLNDMGRMGGLNAISRDLKAKLSDKRGGKYSGESYSQSHAAVVEDINSIADKIGKQIELNFNTTGNDPKAYAEFLRGVPGLVSSPSRVQESITADILADAQGKYTEKMTKLAEDRSVIESELGGAARALSAIGKPTFDAEVSNIERSIKNSCLQERLTSFGDIGDRMWDESRSTHANTYTTGPKKELEKILQDSRLTLQDKLSQIKSIRGLNRFHMKTEGNYEIFEIGANGKLVQKNVTATSKPTPTAFISQIINSCEALYKGKNLTNRITGEGAVKRLRNLNQEFKQLAKTQASDIKKDIRKNLIECATPEIANNSTPASCGPDLFNTSAPGFCANAAFSCSKNMQACTQQAEGYVKEIKAQKTARVNNYKALLDKNKRDIVKIFDSALSKYMNDAEHLRGVFGAGFSSPAGIEREIADGNPKKYMADFQMATAKSPDGKLLLENPDAYIDMFKKNVALLKDSVKKQQDQILGGSQVGTGKNPGLLADHIKATEKNYNAVIRDAEKIAGQCLDNHDKAVKMAEDQRMQQQAEQLKRMTELGEKREKFCNMYGLARTNPQGACSNNIEEIVQNGLEGARHITHPQGQLEARETASNFSAYCKQFGQPSESNNAYDADSLCTIIEIKGQRIITDEVAKTKIDNHCKTLQENLDSCESASVPAGTTAVDTCSEKRADIRKQIAGVYAGFQAVRSGVASSDIELEESPAYCNAGDNSGMNHISKGMQGFSETLQQHLGGAIGQ